MGNAFRHHDPVTFADSFRNPALDRSPAEIRVIGALFFNEFPTSYDCACALDDVEQLRFFFMDGSRLTHNAVFHVDVVRAELEHALSQRILLGRRFGDHCGHFRRSDRRCGWRARRRLSPLCPNRKRQQRNQTRSSHNSYYHAASFSTLCTTKIRQSTDFLYSFCLQSELPLSIRYPLGMRCYWQYHL